MENTFETFQHEKFGKIRVIIIDGEIWFVGKDIATALGYKDASRAIRDHVDVEDKKLVDLNRGVNRPPIADAVSGGWIKNEVTVINESGLYSLILSSKLPQAKAFKRWVTSEVLPAIRKTGSYSLPQVKNAVAVQNSVEMKLIVAPALKDVEISVEMIEKLFFVKHGIALATCINAVEKNHGVDLSDFEDLLPPAEHEIGRYTPSQIGKLIAKEKNIAKFSAQKVNQVLLEKGLQEKDDNGDYILTEKGKEYGEAMPFENNGHTGYQIRWASEIISFFD